MFLPACRQPVSSTSRQPRLVRSTTHDSLSVRRLDAVDGFRCRLDGRWQYHNFASSPLVATQIAKRERSLALTLGFHSTINLFFQLENSTVENIFLDSSASKVTCVGHIRLYDTPRKPPSRAQTPMQIYLPRTNTRTVHGVHSVSTHSNPMRTAASAFKMDEPAAPITAGGVSDIA